MSSKKNYKNNIKHNSKKTKQATRRVKSSCFFYNIESQQLIIDKLNYKEVFKLNILSKMF